MNEEKKLELIADAMDVDVDDITADTELNDIEEWDSVSALSFIAIMDETFNKSIKGSELKNMKTVADLMAIME